MVKVVRIGDFLDIMCPHTGLTGTIKPNSTPIFDIYNVTQEEFQQCRVQGERCSLLNNSADLTPPIADRRYLPHSCGCWQNLPFLCKFTQNFDK